MKRIIVILIAALSFISVNAQQYDGPKKSNHQQRMLYYTKLRMAEATRSGFPNSIVALQSFKDILITSNLKSPSLNIVIANTTTFEEAYNKSSADSNRIQIDIRDLSSGTYSLTVYNENKKFVGYFTVE